MPGFGQESSGKSLLIYDRRDFKKVPATARWTQYLQKLAASEMLYINPYVGTIIENQNRRNMMK